MESPRAVVGVVLVVLVLVVPVAVVEEKDEEDEYRNRRDAVEGSECGRANRHKAAAVARSKMKPRERDSDTRDSMERGAES